jgi:hypothetical protein
MFQSSSGFRALAAISLLSLAPSAEAYLDPSTGSLILSAIVGLLATLGLTFKTWWYRFKALFRRNAPGANAGSGPAGNGAEPAGKDGATGR